MTEKELYKMAMKQNLTDPAELSAEDVAKAKRYGYVKTSAGKYIAVAAAAAIAIGAGVFFAVRSGSKVETAPAASAPECIAAAEPVDSIELDEVISEAEITPETEDLGVYSKFWNLVISQPRSYRTVTSTYENGQNRACAEKLYWFSEDFYGLPASGERASKEISEFFANADDIEFLGTRTNTGESTIDPAVIERFYSTNMSSIHVQFNSETVEEKSEDHSAEGYAEYAVIDGSAYVNIHKYAPDDPEVVIDYLYKVTSPDGRYPMWDGEKLLAPEWMTCEISDSIVRDKAEFRNENGSNTYTAVSADGKISFDYTVDFSQGKPVLRFSNLTARGTEITEGFVSVYVGTEEAWGVKSNGPAHSFEISCVADGYTVDLNEVYTKFAADQITSFNIVAMFNTAEHSARANENQPYAYGVSSYIGIDHRQTES